MMNIVRSAIAVLLSAIVLGGCGGKESSDKTAADSTKPADLSIVSGSENESLEPMIRAFEKQENVRISLTYMGSVDMTLALMEQGKNLSYDAIWPANSLWITLGDQQKAVTHVESIMRSPVVLGIRMSTAKRLEWVGKDITIADIL